MARCSCLRYSEKEIPIYLRKISEAYFSEYPKSVESSFNVRRSPLRLDRRVDKRSAREAESKGVIRGVGQNGCGVVGREWVDGLCHDVFLEDGRLSDETMPILDVWIVRARRSWCMISPDKKQKARDRMTVGSGN